eukprot:12411207-Karenia_brevis.AAC.1
MEISQTNWAVKPATIKCMGGNHWCTLYMCRRTRGLVAKHFGQQPHLNWPWTPAVTLGHTTCSAKQPSHKRAIRMQQEYS